MKTGGIRWLKGLVIGACGALLCSPLVLAHHSFAVHFVSDRLVTVSGVVEEFRFTNPHGVLLFTAMDENGQPVQWKAETNSPSVLRRRGWAKDSLQPGDKVTIEGFPSRDMGNYMRISHVVFDDGRELFAQAKAD